MGLVVYLFSLLYFSWLGGLSQQECRQECRVPGVSRRYRWLGRIPRGAYSIGGRDILEGDILGLPPSRDSGAEYRWESECGDG